MPVYKLAELGEEYVTPKHSTAFGSLVTGEQVELGVLRFKAGYSILMLASRRNSPQFRVSRCT